jgi:hypothetical protein
VEAGNVYLPHPEYAPWVNDFIEECVQFPNGAHDDQVDAMTQAHPALANGSRRNNVRVSGPEGADQPDLGLAFLMRKLPTKSDQASGSMTGFAR